MSTTTSDPASTQEGGPASVGSGSSSDEADMAARRRNFPPSLTEGLARVAVTIVCIHLRAIPLAASLNTRRWGRRSSFVPEASGATDPQRPPSEPQPWSSLRRRSTSIHVPAWLPALQSRKELTLLHPHAPLRSRATIATSVLPCASYLLRLLSC